MKQHRSKLLGFLLIVAVVFGLFAFSGCDEELIGDIADTAYTVITSDTGSSSQNSSNSSNSSSSSSSNSGTQKTTVTNDKIQTGLTFKNSSLLNEHYNKHGIEMGFKSAEEYEQAAAAVAANPNSEHKYEAEDGDDVYYLASTDEIIFVSQKGFIRTYFNPGGRDYFDRQ